MTLLNTLPDAYGVRSPILWNFPHPQPLWELPEVFGLLFLGGSCSQPHGVFTPHMHRQNSAKDSQGSLWRSAECFLCGIASFQDSTLQVPGTLVSLAHHYPSFWLGFVRVTHVCAAGWKLPRCSRLGQLEGSTLLFPAFQSSRTGAGPCARPEDNYFIYFVQFSICLWKEGNSCRGWSFIEAEV